MSDPATENLINDAFDRIRVLERTGHLERAVEARRDLKVIQEEYDDALGDFRSASNDLAAGYDKKDALLEEISQIRGELATKERQLDQIQCDIMKSRRLVEQRHWQAKHIGTRFGAVGTLVDPGSLEGVLAVWQVAVDYFDMSTVFALRRTCKEITALAMVPTLIVREICDDEGSFIYLAPIKKSVLSQAFEETGHEMHTFIIDSFSSHTNYAIHFAEQVLVAALWDAVVIWGPRQMSDYRKGTTSLLSSINSALDHHFPTLLVAVATDEPLTHAHKKTILLLIYHNDDMTMGNTRCVLPLTPSDLYSSHWENHTDFDTRILLRPTIEEQHRYSEDRRFARTICFLAPSDARLDAKDWEQTTRLEIDYVECDWLRDYRH